MSPAEAEALDVTAGRVSVFRKYVQNVENETAILQVVKEIKE